MIHARIAAVNSAPKRFVVAVDGVRLAQFSSEKIKKKRYRAAIAAYHCLPEAPGLNPQKAACAMIAGTDT